MTSRRVALIVALCAGGLVTVSFWPSNCVAYSTDKGMDPWEGSYHTVCNTPLGFAREWPYNSDGPGETWIYRTGKMKPPYADLLFLTLLAAAPAALIGYLVTEGRRDHFETLLTPRSG
jgi:hypothetical protein